MLRLKLLRISQGISQWALAQAAGISQGRYSMIERGLIESLPEERACLAQILCVPGNTLFRPALRVRRQHEEIASDVE